MSRIVVFGNDHRAEGEILAMLDRGWMLAGNPYVQGGGSTTLTLEDDAAIKSFLQFGRLVLVQHEKLSAWAGMIDPPWQPILPVSVAVYNAEYLLSLRSPESPITIEGSVSSIIAQMIDMFNSVDDLYVRMGDTSKADPTPREETLDGRNYWLQIQAILERAGCELLTRAEKDPSSGRLTIYLDIATQLGIDTQFLYFDGRGGNATFENSILDGPIVNRAVGISDQSGQQSRLTTEPFVVEDSKNIYRVRSEMVQFRGVTEQSTLERYTQTYVANLAYPRFSFIINIIDKGDAFYHARLGNLVRAHISNAYLPDGKRGWRGTARIVALAYAESGNELSAMAVSQ